MSENDSAMANATNAAQIEYWNSRVGENWTRNQERLDRAFAVLSQVLVDKVSPPRDAKLIDVGCGCGDLALALAARMGPGGHVLGIDISKPMLERARTRASALAGEHAGFAFIEADATEHAFTADHDLLVSRFGVMFFADPVASFRNLRHALKPGGRFAFLCWAKLDLNPWIGVPLAPLKEMFGPQPPADPTAPGPFAFADKERVAAIFTQAGFVDVSATLVEGAVLLGRADATASGDQQARAVEDALELTMRTGPVAAFLRDADEGAKQEARRRLAAALLPFAVDGGVKLGGTCWLYTGSTPAAPAA
jgi:SAM-dependent methyltransferase